MARQSLTAAAIKNAPTTGKVYRLRDYQPGDPDLKGFHVTISANGAKSFAVAYTSPLDGRRKFVTLGHHPSMSLTDARREARGVREQIRKGIDPADELKKAREALKAAHRAKQEAGTVKDVCELYVRDLRMDGKRSADEVERTFNKNVTPQIGDIPVAELTEDQVLDVMAAFGERRTMHDRCRSYLISAFRLAKRARRNPRWRGKVAIFDITLDIAEVVPKAHKGREKPGTRALSPDEICKVWNEFSADDLSVGAIRLLIATGQRVEEVLHARWEEFDLEAKLWTIPAGRRKQRHHLHVDHIVPLNDIAIEVLKDLPRFKKCPWLFPDKTLKSPRPNETLSQATRRWCSDQGVERFTPRDLRRTWKQRAGRDCKIDLETRNRVQGHAFGDIGSRSYDGLDDPGAYLPEKAAALLKWGRWLRKTITGDMADVVQLRESAR